MRNEVSQKSASRAHRTLGENLDCLFNQIDSSKQMIAMLRRQIYLLEELAKERESTLESLEAIVQSQTKKMQALEGENSAMRKRLPHQVNSVSLFAHKPKMLSSHVVRQPAQKPTWH